MNDVELQCAIDASKFSLISGYVVFSRLNAMKRTIMRLISNLVLNHTFGVDPFGPPARALTRTMYASSSVLILRFLESVRNKEAPSSVF
jgi:hypothetical protein